MYWAELHQNERSSTNPLASDQKMVKFGADSFGFRKSEVDRFIVPFRTQQKVCRAL